jgi:tyrosyl-tRNA synthetase
MMELQEIIHRNCIEFFPDVQTEFFNRILESRRPLRIKLGIDPTGSDIHLGHYILFRKLREFQDAGHTAVLIIGDFTAQIGDPTGKSSTRIQLSSEEVETHAQTYLTQLGLGKSADKSLLDFDTPGRLEIHRNSEWLSKLDLQKIIELMSTGTVGQMLAKEDFGNRYKSGSPIFLHEFLYPILQGYDSVAVDSDIELGGTDQKFNIAMGRDLQKHFGKQPQFGLLLPILPGSDGVQKMSKSLGNTVNLTENPLSMYSKLEKVPDSVVNDYVTLLTDVTLSDLPIDPRERQKAMALQITSQLHGEAAALKAQADAARLMVGAGNCSAELHELPLTPVTFPAKTFYIIRSLNIGMSSSEAKRRIQNRGVKLDGEVLSDPYKIFNSPDELNGKILQLGKSSFWRLIVQ